MKPDEALSETKRKAVNDWFDNTLLSRLNNKESQYQQAPMPRVGAMIKTERLTYYGPAQAKLLRLHASELGYSQKERRAQRLQRLHQSHKSTAVENNMESRSSAAASLRPTPDKFAVERWNRRVLNVKDMKIEAVVTL